MRDRPGRRVTSGALALLTAVALAGCADKEPQPSTTAPAVAPVTSHSPQIQPPVTATTTALAGMPTPVSMGPSPVDSAAITSMNDLPSVFGCPAAVAPIRIPATPTPSSTTSGTTPSTNPSAPATPVAPTSPAGPPAPDALVCTSSLAKEALYLWYTPTQEGKLGALTAALKRAKYVHGGPNWVAAGAVDPQMGTVGGEVYR